MQQRKTDMQQRKTDMQQRKTDMQQRKTDMQQRKTDMQQRKTDMQQRKTDMQQRKTDMQQRKTAVNTLNESSSDEASIKNVPYKMDIFHLYPRVLFRRPPSPKKGHPIILKKYLFKMCR